MADLWQFEFIDNTRQQEEKISGTIEDTISSGINDVVKKGQTTKKTFASEFAKKIEDDTIKNVMISPLNSLTGGLATPIYRTAKRIISGSSVAGALGTFGATLGIMAVQAGIEHLQNRVKQVEEQVSQLNNTDNVLLRAGAVSNATYYSRNFLGIKKTTNRS